MRQPSVRGIRLKTLEEYYALGEGQEGLYRRDNGEFPHGLFDPVLELHLQTVGERLAAYLIHGEPKSLARSAEAAPRCRVDQ
jgi:hypothetical protein